VEPAATDLVTASGTNSDPLRRHGPFLSPEHRGATDGCAMLAF
jgi:hypothetical protein